MDKKKISALVGLVILSLLFVSVPPAKAQPRFVLASWSYPDEYGQGIYAIRVYENSTGDWANYWGWTDYYDPSAFEINASAAIRLTITSTFNATLTGAVSVADGKNYLRHNVTVIDNLGTIVFSQQNFTYLDGADEENGIYDYEYQIDLNFLTDFGNLYIATITYEVFY